MIVYAEASKNTKDEIKQNELMILFFKPRFLIWNNSIALNIVKYKPAIKSIMKSNQSPPASKVKIEESAKNIDI